MVGGGALFVDCCLFDLKVKVGRVELAVGWGRTNVEVERLGVGDLVVLVNLVVVVDPVVVGDLVVVDDTLCCLPLKGSVGGVRGLLVVRVGRAGAV